MCLYRQLAAPNSTQQDRRLTQRATPLSDFFQDRLHSGQHGVFNSTEVFPSHEGTACGCTSICGSKLDPRARGLLCSVDGPALADRPLTSDTPLFSSGFAGRTDVDDNGRFGRAALLALDDTAEETDETVEAAL